MWRNKAADLKSKQAEEIKAKELVWKERAEEWKQKHKEQTDRLKTNDKMVEAAKKVVQVGAQTSNSPST